MLLYVWRPGAKIVAITDIVSACIGIICATLVASAVLYMLFQRNTNSLRSRLYSESDVLTNGSNPSDDIGPGPACTYPVNNIDIGLFAVLCVLILGVQLLASIKLLKAATIGQDPKKAREMAAFWRHIAMAVNIFFCISESWTFFLLVITIVWRGSSLAIVQKFIVELESFIISSENPAGSQADDAAMLM